jgi:hypothetical protein
VDNLKKKGISKPEQCCLCSEKESINHIGSNYISVASRWLHKEKYYVANTISTAVLRRICLIINYFIFNRSDVKLILWKIMKLSVEWRPIYKEWKDEGDDEVPSFLEGLIQEPLRIANASSSSKISFRLV